MLTQVCQASHGFGPALRRRQRTLRLCSGIAGCVGFCRPWAGLLLSTRLLRASTALLAGPASSSAELHCTPALLGLGHAVCDRPSLAMTAASSALGRERDLHSPHGGAKQDAQQGNPERALGPF